jgi:hypothetical protein
MIPVKTPKGTFNVWYPIIQNYPQYFKESDIEKDIWGWDIIYNIKKDFQK